MSLFDDLDYLTPKGTAEFELRNVHIPRSNAKAVTLLVQHAGESNARFVNARTKAPRLTGDAAELQLIELLAKHVVADWRNVHDADGNPVAYTPERGIDLLSKLREKKRFDLTVGLFGFASTADNFTEKVVDAGDLGNG